MVTFLGILLFVLGIIAFAVGCYSEGFEAPQKTPVSDFLVTVGILFLVISGGLGLGEFLATAF